MTHHVPQFNENPVGYHKKLGGLTPSAFVQRVRNTCPTEMALRRQWAMWCWTRKGDSWTKSPHQPIPSNGNPRVPAYASSVDASTWSSLGDVLLAVPQFDVGGLTFMAGGGVVAINFDMPWECTEAQQVLSYFSNTYCERSPGGRLRIFCLATTAPHAGRKHGVAEAYWRDHAMTFTGDWIEGTARQLSAVPAAVDWYFARYLPKPAETPAPAHYVPNSLSADEVVALASNFPGKQGQRFRELMGGNIGGLPSPSEAILALCGQAAFFSREERVVCDVVRRSALYEKKHEDRRPGGTWLTNTARKAIASKQASYKPAYASRQRGETSSWNCDKCNRNNTVDRGENSANGNGEKK